MTNARSGKRCNSCIWLAMAPQPDLCGSVAQVIAEQFAWSANEIRHVAPPKASPERGRAI